MSTSRKKKQKIQAKSLIAILLPTLGALLLLVLILSFGNFTATRPEETTTAPNTLEDNRYSPSDFEYEDGFLTCAASGARLGMDVSEHQQNVDWQQVKEAGIEFVMIRAGYRGYTEGKLFRDSLFLRHIADAREAGLDIGVYFFSQAITPEEARKEAKFLLTMLKDAPAEMGIAFDWEYISADARTGNIDGQTMTDCAIAFCQTIANAGYKPIIYFNQHQALEQYALEDLSTYDFWLAMYNEEMTFPYRVDLWQYTEDGTVPGIEGPVDINLYLP
jgi:GH25 family lysozyme M1 (1,4-beta-N-acetylmuramidase)